MELQEILKELNISAQCKKYRLPLLQCPHFLFLLMGIGIIVAVLTAYAISLRYIDDPQTTALIILFLTGFLFIITYVITHSFERIAEANRLKTEFVNIVSHQLRSPLTNLSWAIEALISGEFGRVEEKQLEYLKILKENNARMGELIQDLITVSKIEEEPLTEEKEKISLEKVIKDLVLKFQPVIQASNIEMKLNINEKLPEILTNPHQIKIVIENLLDNAIRYLPTRQSSAIDKKGSVEILLFQKGKNIYFEIKDNGVGIPRGDQKYIFQKFFRAKNVKELQPYGSGLGLFITKSILERLDGKIWFESEEGKGSTFWFTLPIK